MTVAAERRFAEMLFMGEQLVVIAEQLGVSDRTLRRWRKRPSFVALLGEMQRESLRGSRGALAAVSTRAVAVLVAIMEDTRASTSARASAAGKLLDLALGLVAHVDLDERLAALEATREANT